MSDTLYKELGSEIGDTGLKRSWGLVQEEFLPALQGERAVKVYREMSDNDPVVGSVLYALQQIVGQVTWSVEGPHAAFIDENRQGMSHTWEDFIDEALSMLPYGWAYHEIVYKNDNGRVMWKKLPIRSQESFCRWEFDDNGGTRGMYQQTHMGREVFIPIEKALLFRTTSRRNSPEGRSVLRTAYRSWWFKKRIEEIEATGIERDLAGIPKIGVPAEILQASAGSAESVALEAFKTIGQNLRNDEQACVIYPLAFDDHGNKLYDVELMSSSGRRQFVTDTVIARYSTHIASASLADVILMGHDSVGSYALSESKEALLAVGLQSQVDRIAAVFNNWAIPRLLTLNGLDPKGTRIVPGQLERVNIKDIAEVVWKLTMSGMALFPSETFESWIRQALDAPPAEGTELVVNANTGDRTKPGEPTDPAAANDPSAPPASGK